MILRISACEGAGHNRGCALCTVIFREVQVTALIVVNCELEPGLMEEKME